MVAHSSIAASSQPDPLNNPSDRTVFTLAGIKNDADYKQLFAQGENISCIPQGVAAGKASGVFKRGGFLDFLTRINWYGKHFIRSSRSCGEGVGINRIQNSEYVTFTTAVRDGKYVDLNYSQTQGRFYESSLLGDFYAKRIRKMGIKDTMVKVKGKYGDIFIGKAFSGKYLENGDFLESGFVAWFFLDFNPKALLEQDCEWNNLGFDEKTGRCLK